ncbi:MULTISPECIES: hypothetical protein [Pseudomonas]|uniref:Uncharacterized protein n=1 Tax=Pseudomonas mosselii TaxID=78327 RepID=A0ABX9AUY1_9PSED|nr:MULTISPECIES: hypothetical protein [Pseudomonas]MBP2084185.1 hypothetical protein [Pseudomonas sp. PvP089]MBP2090113.1 hypothetical protein [Pseudomonas sp. PvP088]MBP2223723.1 hypothetical protein [Pseudomonas putida]MCL8298392.1 hypothetical protein [Pseudomonas mosselii]MCL8338409.1 hypothetical protein [Pseudomonas mosselii]
MTTPAQRPPRLKELSLRFERVDNGVIVRARDNILGLANEGDCNVFTNRYELSNYLNALLEDFRL